MIIITCEGGLVQSITTDKPELLKEEVIVVDYDAEGSDDFVFDDEGRECCPSRQTPELVSEATAKGIAELADKRDAAEPED